MVLDSLLVLLFAQAGPAYPLPQRTPDLVAPGSPFVLTDLRYQVADDFGTVQSFAARVRLHDWGFLGAGVSDQTHSVSLQTYRVQLSLAETDGVYELAAGYRAPRLRLEATALRRGFGQGPAATVDLAWRASPDLEVLGGYQEDREPRPLPTAALRKGSLGVLYQRGPSLELAATASVAHVPTVDGFAIGSDVLEASAAGVLHGAELAGDLGFERRSGRLHADQLFGSALADIPLGQHLLASASTSQRWEVGVRRFDTAYAAGLTFFGRHLQLPRSGEAGARTTALRRRANALGANVRDTYDDDSLRALRETLALGPRRDVLASDLADLYAAQVRERNVPQLGVRIESAFDAIRATSTLGLHVLVGVPWRIASPLRRHADSVPFLTFEYAWVRQDFDLAPDTVDHEAGLLVSLNREMSLRFRYVKPGRTPLDLVRISADPRRIEIEYVYAFGR